MELNIVFNRKEKLGTILCICLVKYIYEVIIYESILHIHISTYQRLVVQMEGVPLRKAYASFHSVHSSFKRHIIPASFVSQVENRRQDL